MRSFRSKAMASRPWSGPGGPRVLIENADFVSGDSCERLLIQQGYDVAVCEGPDRHDGSRCRLVETGECDLAASADVVVYTLNLNRPDHAEVLRAVRDRYPAARVVVEIPQPSVERRSELLDGCSVLACPMTRESLANAVGAAMATMPPGEVRLSPI